QSRANAETAAVTRAGLELAAGDRDPLAQADETVAAPVAATHAVAVVADDDLDLIPAVPNEHLRLVGLRVLDGVRQPFLVEPVACEVDARREVPRLPFDLQVDVEPGLPNLVDQLADMAKARLRSQCRRLLRTPQDADEAAHLGERLSAGLLDDQQRLALALL